jgi:hypothetical protein
MHPWDTHHAHQAGLPNRWITRAGGALPGLLLHPSLTLQAPDPMALAGHAVS